MGFCFDHLIVDTADTGLGAWEVSSYMLLVSSAALAVFLIQQYKNNAEEGYYSDSKLVILPMHLKLLCYFLITAFVHGVSVWLLYYFDHGWVLVRLDLLAVLVS